MLGCREHVVNTLLDVQFLVELEFLILREGFGPHFGRLFGPLGDSLVVWEGRGE